MAEFALAVGILQLGKYGVDLVHGLVDVAGRARRAPKSIERRIDEATAFTSLARSILKHNVFLPDNLKGILDTCVQAGDDIITKLQALETTPEDATLNKLKKRLSFVRKEKEFDEISSDLKDCISRLHFETQQLYQAKEARARSLRFMNGIYRNQSFKGQGYVLGQLLDTMHRPDRFPRIAITGYSGTGKSELAIQAASLLQESIPEVSIIWFDGSSEQALQSSLLAFANFITCIANLSSLTLDIHSIRTWLEADISGKWLIVVDDARHDTLFGSLMLHEMLPVNENGTLLFTTRDRSLSTRLASPESVFTLSSMTPYEARMLLQSIVGYNACVEQDIQEMISILKYRPGPLIQAASYIVNRGMRVEEYLAQWKSSDEAGVELYVKAYSETKNNEHSADSMKAQPFTRGDLGACHPRLYDVVIAVACLLPQNIPEKVLRCIAETFRYPGSLQELLQLQIVVWEESTNTFEMDFFVRAGARMQLASSNMDVNILALTVRLMSVVFPQNGNQMTQSSHCQHLCGHVQSVIETTLQQGSFGRSSGQENNALVALTSRVCNYRITTAEYSKADRLLRLMTASKVTLGDSPLAQSMVYNEASRLNLYYGCLNTARGMMRDIYSARIKHLGTYHVHTAHSLHNLAVAYDLSNDSEAAGRYYEKALQVKSSIFGTSHPEIWITETGLALLHMRKGHLNIAEDLLQGIISAQNSAPDPNQNTMLDVYSNLGICLQQQGRYEDAARWHNLALVGRKKFLGDANPETLKTEANIALGLHYRGRPVEADKRLLQISSKFQKILGPVHEETLKTTRNRAIVLRRRGLLEEAEDVITSMLVNLESVDGVHPQTWDALWLLCLILELQGKFAVALAAAKKLPTLAGDRKNLQTQSTVLIQRLTRKIRTGKLWKALQHLCLEGLIAMARLVFLVLSVYTICASFGAMRAHDRFWALSRDFN